MLKIEKLRQQTAFDDISAKNRFQIDERIYN